MAQEITQSRRSYERAPWLTALIEELLAFPDAKHDDQVDREIRVLIKVMARDNSLWGAPRIHGELLKLTYPNRR